MNKCNLKKADSYIDFIKIVTGGKINYLSNPLDEMEIISSGVMFNDAILFRQSLHWNVTLLAEATGISVRAIECHQKSNKPFNQSTSQSMLELAKLSLFGVSYFFKLIYHSTMSNRFALKIIGYHYFLLIICTQLV